MVDNRLLISMRSTAFDSSDLRCAPVSLWCESRLGVTGNEKTPGAGPGVPSTHWQVLSGDYSDCVPAAASVSAACAAASRAIGTRGPEQET